MAILVSQFSLGGVLKVLKMMFFSLRCRINGMCQEFKQNGFFLASAFKKDL